MDYRLHIDNLILFLEEAVLFVVRSKNLSWEPPVSILGLISTTVPFFSQRFGRAITHRSMKDLFLLCEPEWINLPGIKAIKYIPRYLRAIMDEVPEGSYLTYFYFVSFVCHLCAKAIGLDRSEIIPQALMEAVNILYFRCNTHTHFENLIKAALDYNSPHTSKKFRI
ncbi:uncharacterized protein TNCT_408441 [Trichonephila clavata]|uniref:Uncharacterized protein n=1 Tax=Trichonephila clavata TaxID=2740835 RepID=A0A8X6HLL7_TRICU|nr:uncharacterized protein TNCT_408441 [Trichonephila clavata]